MESATVPWVGVVVGSAQSIVVPSMLAVVVVDDFATC